MDRQSIKDLLSESVAIVTFTKKSGDVRVMKCTLKHDLLPPFPEGSEPSGRPVNEEILAVWDLEAEGWRSFRIDSVIGEPYAMAAQD